MDRHLASAITAKLAHDQRSGLHHPLDQRGAHRRTTGISKITKLATLSPHEHPQIEKGTGNQKAIYCTSKLCECRSFRVGGGGSCHIGWLRSPESLRPTSPLVRHTWRSRVGTGQDAPFIELAASWSGGISALTVVLARDRDGAISQALQVLTLTCPPRDHVAAVDKARRDIQPRRLGGNALPDESVSNVNCTLRRHGVLQYESNPDSRPSRAGGR